MANISELDTATLNGLLGGTLSTPSTDPDSPDYSVSPCDVAIWTNGADSNSIWADSSLSASIWTNGSSNSSSWETPCGDSV